MKTLSAMTPMNWAPPPSWPTPQIQQPYYPPPPVQQYHVPIGTVGRSTLPGCIMGVAILGVTLIAVVIPLSATGGLAWLPFFSWDGSEPFRCGANDSVTIHDVTANLANQTAITVEANCELEITDSNIT